MVGSRKNFKVFDTVFGPVVILVMDVFPTFYFSSKMAFHYIAVLWYALVILGALYEPVSVPVGTCCRTACYFTCFVLPVALLRTKFSAIAIQLIGFQMELVPALQAVAIYLSKRCVPPLPDPSRPGTRVGTVNSFLAGVKFENLEASDAD